MELQATGAITIKKITNIFLYGLLALLSFNCSDSHEVQPINELGVRLAAYDEDGVEHTTFEANTDIRFILNIRNISANDITIGAHYDYCNVFEDEKFLLIYKLIRDHKGEEKWTPYGKPFNPPIYCLPINMPIVVPGEGEVKVLGASWNNNPDNPPLTQGRYFTAYVFTLKLEEQVRKYILKLAFEVE
jgi:hypothetical protein